MKTRAYVSVFSVASVALISAFILWRMMVDQSNIGDLGLGGIFLASMLSHMTIIARDIFVPLFLPLTSIYNPFVLGAVAGWGGAIGDASSYFLGWGVAESIRGDSDKDDRLTNWLKRYGFWAVLLFSATPLPDTPIILLAGTSHLSFKRLLLAQGIGKTALYSLGAVVGGLFLTGLTESVGGIYSSVLIVILSIIFCILVSWPRSRDVIFSWMERLIP